MKSASNPAPDPAREEAPSPLRAVDPDALLAELFPAEPAGKAPAVKDAEPVPPRPVFKVR